MSYATLQDLIRWCSAEELILLTDTTNTPPTTIDEDVVNDKLAAADAEIDSWIARRVTTPVDPVPRVLTDKACAVARYFLNKDHATDQQRNDYKDALAWLQAVAQGNVSIAADGGGDVTATSGGPQISTPGDRLFTRDTLKGF